jgi:magnesium-dependent phosphatase 1
MHPKVVVFDLDACLWTTEVKFLSEAPRVEEGVVVSTRAWSGARGDRPVCPPVPVEIRLHHGAALAMWEVATLPEWKDSVVACASKAWKPEYSHACLDAFERLGQCVAIPPARRHVYPKSKDHHAEAIRAQTGVAWEDMLFFDDCTWGDNHADVRRVSEGRATCVYCPNGLGIREWREGVSLHRRRRSGAAAEQP